MMDEDRLRELVAERLRKADGDHMAAIKQIKEELRTVREGSAFDRQLWSVIAAIRRLSREEKRRSE